RTWTSIRLRAPWASRPLSAESLSRTESAKPMDSAIASNNRVSTSPCDDVDRSPGSFCDINRLFQNLSTGLLLATCDQLVKICCFSSDLKSKVDASRPDDQNSQNGYPVSAGI